MRYPNLLPAGCVPALSRIFRHIQIFKPASCVGRRHGESVTEGIVIADPQKTISHWPMVFWSYSFQLLLKASLIFSKKLRRLG